MTKVYTTTTVKFVICFLLSALILSFNSNAKASAHAITPSLAHVTTPSSTEYTIRYFDAEGHLTKTWKGSNDEAQRILASYRQKRQNLSFQQVNTKVVVTPNINRVDPCTIPNDFFDLYNQGLVCFANAGSINVTVYSVYEISSGHNSAYYNFTNSSGELMQNYIGYEASDLFSPAVTINEIYIQ